MGQVLMALGASFGFVGAGFVGGRWFGAIKYGLMFAWVQFVASLSAIFGQKILGNLIETASWSDILNNLTLKPSPKDNSFFPKAIKSSTMDSLT